MKDRLKYLLAETSKGDMDSFAILYKELVNIIYGYLKSRLDMEDTIQDILQDTFMAVWKNSHLYNGQASVVSWVVSIARNKMMDALRRKYKHENASVKINELTISTDDFTEDLTDKLVLKGALKQLNADSKELLYLVYNMGLSYKETASILEIPEGTVKSRMYSIKNDLRKQLDYRGED